MSIRLLEVYGLQEQQNFDHSLWAVDSGIKILLTSLTGQV